MNTHLKTEYPVARKEHVCDACMLLLEIDSYENVKK